jgi:excisionase family DNA binding protein
MSVASLRPTLITASAFRFYEEKMNYNQIQAFDRTEAARRLGLSVVTLDRELARGNITHVRVGRRVLFTQAHLEDYLERNERKAK